MKQPTIEEIREIAESCGINFYTSEAGETRIAGGNKLVKLKRFYRAVEQRVRKQLANEVSLEDEDAEEQQAVQKLHAYLREMNDEEKEMLWEYLDGNPEAIHELIETVATPNLSGKPESIILTEEEQEIVDNLTNYSGIPILGPASSVPKLCNIIRKLSAKPE